ncbi:hypothetical protein P0F65_10470 [Sphingomonas sp. I4]
MRSPAGVVRNYGGFAAPTLPEAYPFALFDGRTPAATPGWHPQVVVVALGTNDFSTPLKPGERWADRDALHDDYEHHYVAFVGRLRKAYPKAFLSSGRPISRMARSVARWARWSRRCARTGNGGWPSSPSAAYPSTGATRTPASPMTSRSPPQSNVRSMRSPTSGLPVDALAPQEPRHAARSQRLRHAG